MSTTGNSRDEHKSPWTALPEGGEKKPKRGYGDFVILVAFLIFVGGVAFLFYTFSIKSSEETPSNISVEFSKPSEILIGEPFPLTVSATNYSDNVLKNARLSIFLPEGIQFVGRPSGERVTEQAVGDVGPGATTKENFNLVILPGTSIRHITAKLVYGFSQTSSVQFESDAAIDLLASQPVVSVSVNAPQSVFNGQDFDIVITYTNNSARDIGDTVLEVEYPPTFRFRKSVPTPANSRNTSWSMGTLKFGGVGTLTISGNMIGFEKVTFDFAATFKVRVAGIEQAVHTQAVSVAIAESPLGISADVNGAREYVAHAGETLNYRVYYANKADISLQGITLRVQLSGEMFDFSTLRANATFDPVAQSLAWSSGHRDFLSLSPQQNGFVDFSIRLKSAFPLRLLSDKNYTLRLDARMESPTVPRTITAPKVVAFTSMENKISGKLDLVGEAFWRDAASGIVNEGSYPPRTGQSTQYTVHWRLINYATDVKNVTVSAYLQSGARFTGVIKSTVDSAPTYNPGSGLVTWLIPLIPATKGFIGPPTEGIFQIEVVPTLSHIGGNVLFLGPTRADWTDAFTGERMQASSLALDTSVPTDTSILGERKVQP